MPENALLWCWSLSSLSGKLPALRRDSRNGGTQSQIDQLRLQQQEQQKHQQLQKQKQQYQQQQQQQQQQQRHTFEAHTIRLNAPDSQRFDNQTRNQFEPNQKGILNCHKHQESADLPQSGSIGFPLSEKNYAKESIYSRVSKVPRDRHKQVDPADTNDPLKKSQSSTVASGDAVYESIITLDPFEMISMAHLNQLGQLQQLASVNLQHLQSTPSSGSLGGVGVHPTMQGLMSAGSQAMGVAQGGLLAGGPPPGGGGVLHTPNGNGAMHPAMSLAGPPVHIVANPMGQDSLYTTIGDVSERVYECPDECPPPVPPKQMEVLYTKPTKVFPKSNGGAALKIYKTRENVPTSPTKDSSGSGTSSSDTRDLQQENYALKQEILAYRERMKALAVKLEQFDGISAVVEELQEKVDKVSQENERLRCFEREHRESQEQLKEAQRQYKLDVDQLSSQVAILDGERSDLECSLAKLQEEHDCLMISSQNSVSFQYHSQAMLEVKRLLEELKNKYQNDKESLLLRVEVAEQEKMALKANLTRLEEEVSSLHTERDQLDQGYRKAVRQRQSLVQHIKELQSEDSEMHALMQSLLQSAHQAVAERDTLERLVKPTGLGGHGESAKSTGDHRQLAGGGQGQQPPGQTTLPQCADAQPGDWTKDQNFLSC